MMNCPDKKKINYQFFTARSFLDLSSLGENRLKRIGFSLVCDLLHFLISSNFEILKIELGNISQLLIYCCKCKFSIQIQSKYHEVS